MTKQQRRSRYDLPDDPAPGPTNIPIQVGTPWETSPETMEARRLLETSRGDVERVVQHEMRRLEGALATRAEHVGSQLQATRAEIERLERETAAMRANRYDDVLRQLRDRVNAI